MILSSSDIKILKWYKAMGVDEIHSNNTRTYIKKIKTQRFLSKNSEIYTVPTSSIILPKEKTYVENRKTFLLDMTASEIYSYACKIKENSI